MHAANTKVDAILLDGSVIVNMLHPKACETFGDYAETVFKPYILRHLDDAKRIDIVWDRYISNSLKRSTREGGFVANRYGLNSFTIFST